MAAGMQEGGEDELQLPLVQREGGSSYDSLSSAARARRGTTVFQTVCNFLNIFCGTGLQSMPYALARGGWAALAAQALIMPLFALSGLLIVRAFDQLPATTPRTYPELGRAAAGRAGVRGVMLFSFMELFGGSIIVLMVMWQMLQLLLPPGGWGALSGMHLSAVVSSLCLLPLLFVDLKRLSKLSVVGMGSNALIILLVVSLLFLDPQRASAPQPPPGHHLLGVGIIQAVGIFALSSTAHSTLPALRIAMAQPSRFPLALGLGFTVMLLGYSTLAAAGYWYWGDAATPLVTNDLATASCFSAGRFPIHRVLAAFVLLLQLTKYPGLNLVLQDMILSVLPISREGGEYHPRTAVYALRLGLFGAALVLALTAYDFLGSTLSLLGGLGSITCSLLLPTAFYASLSWRRLRLAAKAGLLAMLALGAVLVALVTTTNLCDMVESCRDRRKAPAAAVAALLHIPPLA